ncbi:MAG: DUF4388 domain-containing protein [Polyangiaceae bacterium]
MYSDAQPAGEPRFVLAASSEVAASVAPALADWGRPIVMAQDKAELVELLKETHERDFVITELELGSEDLLGVVADFPHIASATVLLAATIRPSELDRARRLGIRRVVELPLLEDELDEALRYLWDSGEVADCAVHGLSLVDLLQAYHQARRTLQIVIGTREEGSLALIDGELVDARWHDERGPQALDRLLAENDVPVRTAPLHVEHCEPSLQGDFSMLILDALRRRDEDQRLPELDQDEVDAVTRAMDRGGVARISVLPNETDLPPASEPPPDSVPSSSGNEIRTRAALDRLYPEAHLARVVDGELRWSTSPPREVSSLSWLTRRELTSAAGRWMVFVCNGPNRGGRAVGVFGEAPWIWVADLSSRRPLQPFLSAVLRAAAQLEGGPCAGEDEGELVPAGGPHATAVTKLLERCPALTACGVLHEGSVSWAEREDRRTRSCAVPDVCLEALGSRDSDVARVFFGNEATQAKGFGKRVGDLGVVGCVEKGKLGYGQRDVERATPWLEAALGLA